MSGIAITLGDPAGIGPEVTEKAIQQLTSHPGIILFGHAQHVSSFEPFTGLLKKNTVYGYPIKTSKQPSLTPDDPSNAIIAYESIQSALACCNEYSIKRLVTAPISKAGLLAANIPYTGHTSMLKDHFNCPNASMAFYSDQLSIVLATIHIPLMQVEENLTSNRIHQSIKNATLFAKQLGIQSPKIGIAGLNPHASEHGQFGDFESSILIPTIKEAQCSETTIIGPISPDVIFRQALNNEFDIVIALYHDQGLIPLKLLAFDTAVNVTIGLPICRTSPDHGTAYDITNQDKANPNSMLAAIKYCMNQ